MILGIGVDLCAIHRIETLHKKTKKFAEKILSSETIDNDIVNILAKKWAVLEAVAKASRLGLGLLGFKNLTLKNHDDGAPFVELTSEAQELIKKKFAVKKFNLHISISHEHDCVCAMAVIEKND